MTATQLGLLISIQVVAIGGDGGGWSPAVMMGLGSVEREEERVQGREREK
ncbi:hypothetical protein HanPSC8_Chr15g0644261 [Helianthus annuus]|nr:hypothetical protein HanIR_Chr15g0728881 [Helianthus annuus]KAJ0829464.1 hypothetical protein HanPSC8_Chr15g0644261 [Helianthus annuus]